MKKKYSNAKKYAFLREISTIILYSRNMLSNGNVLKKTVFPKESCKRFDNILSLILKEDDAIEKMMEKYENEEEKK